MVASALLAAGRRTPARALTLLDAVAGHLALGRWLRARGLPDPPRVATKDDLFDLAIDGAPEGRLLYLEFGVHEGASIRHWVERVRRADASFWGFDSFEGLPEAWNEQHPKGRFSTGGAPPRIDDERVRFVTGWFDDTLPGWEPPEHDVLVVNLDADLYSSTITVLRALRPHLRPGTWLHLDELNDRHHELRALDEFLDESGLRVEVVAAAANLRHWLLRVR